MDEDDIDDGIDTGDDESKDNVKNGKNSDDSEGDSVSLEAAESSTIKKGKKLGLKKEVDTNNLKSCDKSQNNFDKNESNTANSGKTNVDKGAPGEKSTIEQESDEEKVTFDVFADDKEEHNSGPVKPDTCPSYDNSNNNNNNNLKAGQGLNSCAAEGENAEIINGWDEMRGDALELADTTAEEGNNLTQTSVNDCSFGNTNNAFRAEDNDNHVLIDTVCDEENADVIFKEQKNMPVSGAEQKVHSEKIITQQEQQDDSRLDLERQEAQEQIREEQAKKEQARQDQLRLEQEAAVKKETERQEAIKQEAALAEKEEEFSCVISDLNRRLERLGFSRSASAPDFRPDNGDSCLMSLLDQGGQQKISTLLKKNIIM